ncbi:tail fiber assembly protein [Rahnella inusitata]|uniref:tail fiber assembly protein n=1 Tax=Rahnella inusitata TaxID=58169 RepID=UPI001BC84EAE|nr:tail fiber assembly protein [Rahnella inusitata]QUT14059.1 tail fiber assembly protein [Rahnella inusitata]
MIENYAVITNDVVTSIIVWDGITDFGESGLELVPFQDGCIVGSTYVGGVFTLPPAPEKTHEEMVAESDNQKQALIAQATEIIAPMADAQAGGYIEDADIPVLQAWQKYRYALTKVDTGKAPDILWPATPTT